MAVNALHAEAPPPPAQNTDQPISSSDGSDVIKNGVKLWSDRDYVAAEWPESLTGRVFARSPMDGSKVTINKSGYALAVTPVLGQVGGFSEENALQEAGFSRLDIKPFVPFSGGRKNGDVCRVYQKKVEPGETLSFHKYCVMLWAADPLPIPEKKTLPNSEAASEVADLNPPDNAIGGFVQNQGGESPKERDARMAWWRDARFGMFIHWGLFSAAGGVWNGKQCGIACKMQVRTKIPADEYATLTKKFTGENFDPEFIAQLAKDAGMQYVIPIAKHHEGFCLYDSKLTDYKITNTPAKRDWIRETLDAVRAKGLRVGIYFSLWDWHWLPPGSNEKPGQAEWSKAVYQGNDGLFKTFFEDKEVWEQLMTYMHGQVEELMTRYGKIDIFWPDYSKDEFSGERWRSSEMVAMIRKHQPQIIINNRLADYIKGAPFNPAWGMDFQTPEQHIPPTGFPGKDWEACQTMNRTWEYTHFDRDWKSPTTLIQQLIDTVSKGGNYLLNIGPKPDGSVPQSTIDTLHAIGGWMKVHGESIYGTVANPFPNGVPWGRCTLKHLPDGNTRLYCHIFQLPWTSRLQIPALKNDIASVWLLSDPGRPKLSFNRDAEGGTVVELPTAEVNDYATVVVVDLRGEVRLGDSAKVVSEQTK